MERKPISDAVLREMELTKGSYFIYSGGKEIGIGTSDGGRDYGYKENLFLESKDQLQPPTAK